jgi:hypothetical protein
MTQIGKYILFGITFLTMATCIAIIVLGICECIMLHKKRRRAFIIPSIIIERKDDIDTYTYNPQIIEDIIF